MNTPTNHIQRIEDLIKKLQSPIAIIDDVEVWKGIFRELTAAKDAARKPARADDILEAINEGEP